MIVVSDTSPLNYLVLIDHQHLLPTLFQRILIPTAVREELESPGAPEAVGRFLASAPSWLETRAVSGLDPSLQHLDPGERDAIQLAVSSQCELVLIDERKGREAARARGLAVAGTLGVLERAAARGLLTLPEALLRLEGTTFRASPRLIGLIKARESE